MCCTLSGVDVTNLAVRGGALAARIYNWRQNYLRDFARKGLSDGLPTSKGEIKLSLVHPLHAVLCRFSTCRKQQTPQL